MTTERVTPGKTTKHLLKTLRPTRCLYDSRDLMSTNLVLVKAKRTNSFHMTVGQLVSYMGIVHRAREEQRKQNRVVYGIGTDGDNFQFWRVDNDSETRKISAVSSQVSTRRCIPSFLDIYPQPPTVALWRMARVWGVRQPQSGQSCQEIRRKR